MNNPNTINEELNKFESRRLADIADVAAGMHISKEDYCDSGISVIRSADIQNGQIIKSNLYVPESNAEKYADQLLQEGDILLTRIGGRHEFAQVTEDDIPAVATENLFIIRPYGVTDNYLFCYLTSETGKAIFNKQLSDIEDTGNTLITICRKELENLMIPIFSDEIMYALSNTRNASDDDIMDIISCMYVCDNANEIRIEEREQIVVNAFRNIGWKDEEIDCAARMFWKKSDGKYITRPDMVLLHENKCLAIVEVKNNLARINMDRIHSWLQMLQNGEIPFFILTTGYYYEIHSANNMIVGKMLTPPSKEYLLSILNGKEAE